MYFLLGIFFSIHSYGSDSKDSINSTPVFFKSEFLKSTLPSGSISLGYDYGAVPFVVQGNYPTGFFRTDGNTSVHLFSLPFNASWYYTTLKNVSGLNNYFRFSFNAQQYRENLLQGVNKELDSLKNLNKGLHLQKQQLSKKLLYYKHQANKFSVPDSLILPNGNLSDSFSVVFPALSTMNLPSGISKDSINKIARDYLSDQTIQLNSEINLLEEKIDFINQRINTFSSPQSAIPVFTASLSPMQRFFTSVKRLDIGMCYPDFSPVFVQSLVLRICAWKNNQ
jgi:hypothetical protein